MSNEKVFQMEFSKIYDALLGKATRKGRTKDEVICWLTGYSEEWEIAGHVLLFPSTFSIIKSL